VITIVNINEKFGDAETFRGETLDDAVEKMANALFECGLEFADIKAEPLHEGEDCEVIP
jgi:hypothetical protein